MKLSELIDQRLEAAAAAESGHDVEALPTIVYGVEIDHEFVSFDPPVGVAEIGLVARFTGGEFRDEVLDIATAYKMATTKPAVLLEIPAEEDIGSVRHVVSTIENVKAAASFLPPEDLTDESFELYCQRLEAVAEEWVARKGFEEVILPVTSYFQHMIVELLDPELGKSFVPDDPYIIDRFHSRIPLEKSDALKSRLRAVIRAAFTDEEGVDRFDETMLVLCQRQIADVEKVTAQLAENHAAIMAAHAPQTAPASGKKPRSKKPAVKKRATKSKKGTTNTKKPSADKGPAKAAAPKASVSKITDSMTPGAKPSAKSSAKPKTKKSKAPTRRKPATE